MIVASPLRLEPSAVLAVAFAGVRQQLGGVQREFSRSLAALDCAALLVRDTESRWYQYGEAAAAALIGEIRAAAGQVGARRLVCLGNSMGGFGALYFGARLKADAILGFAAQTAIDPETTEALGDRRWSEHQAAIPAYGFGDLAREPAAPGRVILCRGEHDLLDRAHADHLAAAWRVEQIVVPEAKHDVAARLRERGELLPLLEQVIRG